MQGSPRREHLETRAPRSGGTGGNRLTMVTIQPIRSKSLRDISTIKMAVTKNRLSLALICPLVCLVSCNLCSDKFMSKAISADGKLVANVSERNCGATTDFSTMVNVQSTSVGFRAEEGLLFVVQGVYDLSVAWIGPRTLLITCARCARENISYEMVAFANIDVTYNLGEDLRN